MRLLLVVAACGLSLGCNKDAPPDTGKRGGTPSAQSLTSEQRLACKVDADCTLSTQSFKDDEYGCCPHLCLRFAMNAEAAEKLDAACEGASLDHCVKEDCDEPTEEARCVENKCTVCKDGVCDSASDER
jgi:hypothetical protein